MDWMNSGRAPTTDTIFMGYTVSFKRRTADQLVKSGTQRSPAAQQTQQEMSWNNPQEATNMTHSSGWQRDKRLNSTRERATARTACRARNEQSETTKGLVAIRSTVRPGHQAILSGPMLAIPLNEAAETPSCADQNVGYGGVHDYDPFSASTCCKSIRDLSPLA
jgi:hypothetical protein